MSFAPQVAAQNSQAPRCVYVDEADPNARLWLENDGTLVAERLGEQTRYPTSMGGGTGIMTRVYRAENPDEPEIGVLFVDLSDIAKPGAPTSLAVAFGNVYVPRCTD